MSLSTNPPTSPPPTLNVDMEPRVTEFIEQWDRIQDSFEQSLSQIQTATPLERLKILSYMQTHPIHIAGQNFPIHVPKPVSLALRLHRWAESRRRPQKAKVHPEPQPESQHVAEATSETCPENTALVRNSTQDVPSILSEPTALNTGPTQPATAGTPYDPQSDATRMQATNGEAHAALYYLRRYDPNLYRLMWNYNRYLYFAARYNYQGPMYGPQRSASVTAFRGVEPPSSRPGHTSSEGEYVYSERERGRSPATNQTSSLNPERLEQALQQLREAGTGCR